MYPFRGWALELPLAAFNYVVLMRATRRRAAGAPDRDDSFLIRRPVREILVGCHVRRGHMWPYVLLTYLLSQLIVGTTLHPGR
jgi:hypothetical protein